MGLGCKALINKTALKNIAVFAQYYCVVLEHQITRVFKRTMLSSQTACQKVLMLGLLNLVVLGLESLLRLQVHIYVPDQINGTISLHCKHFKYTLGL